MSDNHLICLWVILLVTAYALSSISIIIAHCSHLDVLICGLRDYYAAALFLKCNQTRRSPGLVSEWSPWIVEISTSQTGLFPKHWSRRNLSNMPGTSNWSSFWRGWDIWGLNFKGFKPTNSEADTENTGEADTEVKCNRLLLNKLALPKKWKFLICIAALPKKNRSVLN